MGGGGWPCFPLRDLCQDPFLVLQGLRGVPGRAVAPSPVPGLQAGSLGTRGRRKALSAGHADPRSLSVIASALRRCD